ncbi:uncharacterized protein LOC112588148 [Harpegnathos saltator]|uniref:uncharacterized protein LOC112588148 n=1 Tax=Harpegnathos saltator TaxID=610380 RepID=UPI000DBEE5C8|nr:uncharacterized protein LOC112588148 [Harpegnathos saltator]
MGRQAEELRALKAAAFKALSSRGGGSTSTEEELRDARTLERKRRKKRTTARLPPPPFSEEFEMEVGPGKGTARPGAPKPPKSAAITVRCSDCHYHELMAEARRRIKPKDLGIDGPLRIQRALSGAMMVEVPGLKAGPSADRLAGELRKLAAEKDPDFQVQRPEKVAALRLFGLDPGPGIGAEEVAAAVDCAGGCTPAEISAGGINVSQRGVGAMVVRCPLAVAAKRVPVGWTRAGVTTLPPRAQLCFRCLVWGHVRERCTSTVDRSGLCYCYEGDVCPDTPPTRDGVEGVGPDTLPTRDPPEMTPPSRDQGEDGEVASTVLMSQEWGTQYARDTSSSDTRMETAPLGRKKRTGTEDKEAEGFRRGPGPEKKGEEAPAQEATDIKVNTPSGETGTALPSEVSHEGVDVDSPEEARVLGTGTRAQDLFCNRILELGAGLGVATEPHYVLHTSKGWFGSSDGSVAMVANPAAGTPPCVLRAKGSSFVAVDCGPITVVGVYLHHRKNNKGLGDLARIERVLDRIGDLVRWCYPRPIVIAGNFNAHSEGWGYSPWQRDSRGEALIDWAVGLGLSLINEGSAITCVRLNGE